MEDIKWIVDFALFLSTSSVTIWMSNIDWINDDSNAIWLHSLRSSLSSNSITLGMNKFNKSSSCETNLGVHSSLNVLLSNVIPDCVNTRVPWLIEDQPNLTEKLKLRFDSQVYIYTNAEENVSIEEIFAFRGEISQRQLISVWDRGKRKFTFVNREHIWKRRSDLLGATVWLVLDCELCQINNWHLLCFEYIQILDMAHVWEATRHGQY